MAVLVARMVVTLILLGLAAVLVIRGDGGQLPGAIVGSIAAFWLPSTFAPPDAALGATSAPAPPAVPDEGGNEDG